MSIIDLDVPSANYMWRTSENVETYAGSLSLVLAYGLSDMIEQLNECYECGSDDHYFGHKAFARLTLEQKAWTLRMITFGLLDREIPAVPLTAFFDAAVAAIFRRLEELVAVEIGMAETKGEAAPDWCYDVRRAILAVHEKDGMNSPDFLDGNEPLKVDCVDMEQWQDAIAGIWEDILWDDDYAMLTIEDMPPKLATEARTKLGIDNDYFIAIPDDPQPTEAQRLLQEADALCTRVIEREAKILTSI